MKNILFILLLFSAGLARPQGTQVNYVVTSIANMKIFNGAANRIYVIAKNADYIRCDTCTANETTIYAGVGLRKWKRITDSTRTTLSALDSAFLANAFTIDVSNAVGTDSAATFPAANKMLLTKTTYEPPLESIHNAGDSLHTIRINALDSSKVTGLHTEAYYNTKYGTSNSTGVDIDSLKVLAANPTTGNIYINSTDKRIHYRTGGYWYRLAVQDSIAGPVLEALNFTSTNGDFVQSPTGVWSDALADGEGVASKSLAASTDGWIEAEYQTTANQNTRIGLDGDNTVSGAGSWDFVLQITTGGAYFTYGTSSSNVTSLAPVSGDKFRINRIGSTVTAEYYRGGVWTVFRTYSGGTSAQLYLKAQSVTAQVLNPKGYNLQ